MSQVEQLEEAVRRLSPEDLALFRAWYSKFDSELWDQQLDADVAAGRLDWLAQEAQRDLESGRCTER